MKQQKLTRSQFEVKMRVEMERLIADARMPPLDKLGCSRRDAEEIPSADSGRQKAVALIDQRPLFKI
jgi:hypothetical protein